MVDALSRKEVIAYVAALSNVVSDFFELIKEQSLKDVAYTKIANEIKLCLVRRYWIEDGLIYGKGGRQCRP